MSLDKTMKAEYTSCYYSEITKSWVYHVQYGNEICKGQAKSESDAIRKIVEKLAEMKLRQ